MTKQDTYIKKTNELLLEIGEDLMGALGFEYPPIDFPSVQKMEDEMKECGAPFNDDAMISVCAVNAQKIAEFIKSNATTKIMKGLGL